MSLVLGPWLQLLEDFTDLGNRCDTEFRCRRYLSWKRADAYGMVRRWSIHHARAQKASFVSVRKTEHRRDSWLLCSKMG